MCTTNRLCSDLTCDLCFSRSFAVKPASKFWSTKNGRLQPRNVFRSTHKSFWFDCPECKHAFLKSPHDIGDQSLNICTYCVSSSRLLCKNLDCEICFEKSFASFKHETLIWSVKNKLDSRFVRKHCNKRFILNCSKCLHEFQIAPNNLCSGRGRGCPYCCVPTKRLCDNLECKSCPERSFAAHPWSIHWSIRNVKTARQVVLNSAKKYWFDCPDCSHTFDQRPSAIAKGVWCVFCAGGLCNDDDCHTCFSKSFASHWKVVYWSVINKEDPRTIRKGSSSKFWFFCIDCHHVFRARMEHFVNSDYGCHYCCIPTKKLCANSDCDNCHEKSFASHPKSKFWSSVNSKTARQVAKSTADSYVFDCNDCKKTFTIALERLDRGQWCPNHVKKTELKLYNILRLHFPTIQREFCPRWCLNETTNYHYRFDFVIPELKLIIELDGPQHFQFVREDWRTVKEQQKVDVFKMGKGVENGYRIIRVIQKEVIKPKYNPAVLLETITKNIKTPILYLFLDQIFDNVQDLFNHADFMSYC